MVSRLPSIVHGLAFRQELSHPSAWYSILFALADPSFRGNTSEISLQGSYGSIGAKISRYLLLTCNCVDILCWPNLFLAIQVYHPSSSGFRLKIRRIDWKLSLKTDTSMRSCRMAEPSVILCLSRYQSYFKSSRSPEAIVQVIVALLPSG